MEIKTQSPYEGQLKEVLTKGKLCANRTDTAAYKHFGLQARYDLQAYFPLITSKKIHVRSMVGELFWMMRGETNIKLLNEEGITIWDEWADADGDLGPIYGKQWRAWDTGFRIDEKAPHYITLFAHKIDQLKWVVDEIKINPDSRRLIVTAWNPSDLPDMALAPCHCFFQFFVLDGKLSCQLYQRSADMFLGVPFNIASYALLTHLVAKCCGLEVGEFIHTIGDAHIYENHLDQVREQLSRDARPLPQIEITGEHAYPWEFEPEDVKFLNYDPHPAIKAPVAV